MKELEIRKLDLQEAMNSRQIVRAQEIQRAIESLENRLRGWRARYAQRHKAVNGWPVIGSLFGRIADIVQEEKQSFVDGKFPDQEAITNTDITKPALKRHILDAAETDKSGEARIRAISRGFILARYYALPGSGLGTYHYLDPQYTAAHTLPLQILVEGGVLTFLGIAIVFGYAVVRTGRLLILPTGQSINPEFVLSLSGSASCSAFLVHGILTGDNLILGGFTVWGFLLAFCMGLSLAHTAKA
jgi:hypothetical protein